jgi:hypothetical protein
VPSEMSWSSVNGETIDEALRSGWTMTITSYSRI